MWICPNCQRSFHSQNQAHSCHLKPLEAHFDQRSPVLKQIFDQIAAEITSWGPITIDSTPGAITAKAKTTFAAFKVKKDHLVVEFFLDHPDDVPPITKIFPYSKNRFVHYLSLDSPDDLNGRFWKWLRGSYDLIEGK